MKKSFLLLITLVVSIVAMAGPVTPDEARQNVAQFMNPRRAAAVTQNPNALRLVSTSHYQVQKNTLAPSYYIFNVGKGEGYVIAAADDRVPAVLGYSNRGQIDPDNMPENMKEWLQSYSDQLEFLNSHPEASVARRTVTGEAISPMLDARYSEGPIAWDQSEPFNKFCPLDGSSHSLVGCVATAMAQIMYYWKYPAATTDSIPGYTTKKRKIQMPGISAGTAIDWDNMLPRYTGYETDAQKNAVANLMLLCGTAVEMDYTFDFSGASTALAARALRDYFDYDEATNYRQRVDYHEGEWNQKVYDELKAGRPVYYDGDSSGSGHAFVVDGYGGDDYFHVNWGWGGSSNDYFLLSILDSKNNSGSGASKSADGYSFGQGAIFGVQPNTGKPDKELRLMTATAGAIFCDTVMTRKSINENFKINLGFGIVNHWDATYKFDIGMACVDAYGQMLYDVSLGSNIELGPDWGITDPANIAVDFTFGKGTNELTCYVIPVSRPAGTSTWYPSIGAYDYYVGINIKDNTLRLFPPVFKLDGTLAYTGKKEAKTPIPVQTTITNNGTFWKGELFFMLNGKMTGGRHFDIEAGQTKPLDFTVIPDSAGRYEIAVATRQYNSKTNDYDYTTFIVDSVTVDSAAAANLTLTYDVTNATNYVVKEDTLKLLVAATNNGNDTYENQILADLYKDGHDGYYYNTKTLKKDVKIAAGETVQLPFDFVNLEDDSYLFIIKYLSEGEWKSIQTKAFTVQTREPDPVPVLSTTSKTANAVRESGTWIVKTDTAFVSVLAKNTGTIDYNDNIVVRLYQMTTATGGPQVAVARTFVNLPVGADTTFVVQFPGLEDGATYFYWTNYVADNKETPGSQNTPMFTVMLPKPVEETGYYLVSDLNSWSTTDQSYPFEKLRDGKSWEITFKAPDNKDLWLKVAPASAYDDQDGFWTHLFCAVQNGTSDLSGTMIVGDAGAWLMPASLNAETYTMRIVPSEMTYTITYTEKTDGIQMVSNGQQGNVTIYGVNGNKVDEVNASNLQQRLKSLPKGLYIVRYGQKTATIRN